MTDPSTLAVSVILLNYQTPAMVEDCLRTLDGQLVPGIAEAVVVDNNSGDGSADAIESAIERAGWGDWARVVRSAVNGGFAAGNNVGIDASDGKVLVLLNSDTLVREGAIETLMDALAARSELGLVGPRLEWPDGTHQISTFRFRTPLTELISSARSGWLGRRFLRHVVARELVEPADDLDWASFACIAVRREVVEQIGLLDEKYFMYFEDMDFCRRARGAGFGVGYEPSARVVHLRGGTSPVKEASLQRRRRPAYFYAARSHYFRRWYGRSGYILANLLWTIGWVLAVVRGKSRSVDREWRDIWSPEKFQGRKPVEVPVDPKGAAHA